MRTTPGVPLARPAFRPSPSTPLMAPRALQSAAALRHRGVELWSHHWHGAHAPAWASRDAFIAACAADPTLSVDTWLAVTEPRAAWIAVEDALPLGRVRYLAHRSWDAWWPLWRAAAPRLGSYPVAALASWLDASVRKGKAVDPRPHLAAPHPPDPAAAKPTSSPRWGGAQPHNAVTYVARPAARRPAAAPSAKPTLAITGLLLLGLGMLLWAQNAQEFQHQAHLARPATSLALALLGTALGILHSCAPLEVGEDPSLRIRRLWPMGLALMTWFPFIRSLA